MKPKYMYVATHIELPDREPEVTIRALGVVKETNLRYYVHRKIPNKTTALSGGANGWWVAKNARDICWTPEEALRRYENKVLRERANAEVRITRCDETLDLIDKAGTDPQVIIGREKEMEARIKRRRELPLKDLL